MRLAERHEREAGAEGEVHETIEGACGGVLYDRIVGAVAKWANVWQRRGVSNTRLEENTVG
jgi:hypothetical protein